MLIKSTSRFDSPEVVFATFKNAEGATIPKDAVCQLDLSTSADGIRVVQPNTNELNVVVGIAHAAAADGEPVLVQVYGYRSTSKVLLTDTSLAAGLKLTPVAGQDYLGSLAAGDGRDAFFVLVESHTTATGTTSKKIHIRCL